MKTTPGGLHYSPRDLLTYMDSSMVSWMNRLHLEQPGRLAPEPTSGFVAMIQACGLEHEARFLSAVRETHGPVLDLSGQCSCRTEEAMRRGVHILYQAQLTSGHWSGIADFLVRVEGPSRLGSYHYEVWDTKLAREPKPYYLVQLCCYAEMLGHLQEVRPREVCVADRSCQLRRFRTRDFFPFYLELKRSFLEFQHVFDADQPPSITGNEDFGRWEKEIRTRLEQKDALCRVAGITGSQIRKLHDAGITTMEALAASEGPVRKLASETLEKLRRQARLQLSSIGLPRPAFELIRPDPDCPRQGLAMLPPASADDIFFDIEGYPLYEDGLEYLLGASYLEDGKLPFRAWWAHNRQQEQASFESFVTWVYERWSRNRKVHVYHYAPYETSALKRLIRIHHYGCGEKLDELLRRGVFVDLYQVVRQSLIVGEPRYSLKNIEQLYRSKREGEVTTAGDSIVEYATWIASGESPDPEHSPILRGIRDYNQVDCESTAELCEWLRALQRNERIPYLATGDDSGEPTTLSPPTEANLLAQELLSELPAAGEPLTEAERLQQLLAHLLEFHKREEKPVWWQHFTWLAATTEELISDAACLGGLRRTEREPFTVPRGRSLHYEYSFDLHQETRLEPGGACFLAHDGSRAMLQSLDRTAGLATVSVSKAKEPPPSSVSLLPDDYVSAGPIAASILETVRNWRSGGALPPALEDLLLRRPPRIRSHKAGSPLITVGTNTVEQTTQLVAGMDRTTLSIQGPPGTGKTYTAARAIVALVRAGRRVGIAANSHKAILNLECEVARVAEAEGVPLRGLHVGTAVSESELPSGFNAGKPEPRDLPDVLGGTAWAFAAPALAGTLSHLFVDEAGQVCLANVVGMSRAAENLVLIGDQMQLGQPIQATHPGESGLSVLEYLFGDQPTVAQNFGIFLGVSRRMHPALCRFVSESFYEARLGFHPSTESRYLALERPKHIRKSAGLEYTPVPHTGNTQSSPEEVEKTADLVEELLSPAVRLIDRGQSRRLALSDILIMAPYNLQVRAIERRIPGARVGSVDRFQGQEAPVSIFAMCASSASDCGRGPDFLFSPNRMNVALSRAQVLAVVVASPDLGRFVPSSIEQMRMLGPYCRIVSSGTGS